MPWHYGKVRIYLKGKHKVFRGVDKSKERINDYITLLVHPFIRDKSPIPSGLFHRLLFNNTKL